MNRQYRDCGIGRLSLIRRFPDRTLSLVLCFVALLIGDNIAAASPTVVDTQSGPKQLYSDSYALIIGESKYQRTDSAHWNQLDNVPQETKALAEALQELGFDANKINLQPDVASANLLGLFQAFINDPAHQDPNARLFIYFAGHGATDNTQQGFLVPVDAPDQRSPTFYNKALSMAAVKAVLERARARHTMVVFDSCFSGSILETRDALVPVPNLRLESIMRKGVLVVTAGTADQKVPAESEFLEVFMRGAKGAADAWKQGYVTGVQLSDYLKTHTAKTSPHDGVIVGDSSGQIVFIPNSANPRPRIEGEAVSTKQVSGQNTTRYASAIGSFNFTDGKWSFVKSGEVEDAGERLVPQVSGGQAVLLWNAKKDEMYEIPPAGGTVRVKRQDRFSWTDFGVFEKK